MDGIKHKTYVSRAVITLRSFDGELAHLWFRVLSNYLSIAQVLTEYEDEEADRYDLIEIHESKLALIEHDLDMIKSYIESMKGEKRNDKVTTSSKEES